MMWLVPAIWMSAVVHPAEEPKPAPAPCVRLDDELAELRAQIARDMQAVEKKLQGGDAGEQTRRLQQAIVENLDRLLKKSQEQSSSPSPMSERTPSSSPGAPKAGSPPSSTTRRERREAHRRQQQSRAGASRQRGGAQAQSGSGQPEDPVGATGRSGVRTGSADSMADVAKDIWGHLPESLRQEVDHYYRERFMPRYRDLLQQYYLRLAESERRPGPKP